MSNFINKVYKNNAIVYKVLLFLITTVSIVYLFPKGGQFKYDFNKGKPWQYDNLYATFDFSIQKSDDEINQEKQNLTRNNKQYFEFDNVIVLAAKTNFTNKINYIQENDSIELQQMLSLISIGNFVIDEVYKYGFIEIGSQGKIFNENEIIYLRNDNEVTEFAYNKLLIYKEVLQLITDNIGSSPLNYGENLLLNTLLEVLKPNVSYDTTFTQKALEESFKNISYTKGLITTGELIILKGDIVEGKKLEVLNSLKIESESKVWSESNYIWIVCGYTILVSLALLMLLLFLKKYREDIYQNNNKVTFIFFNVFLMVLIQTLVIKYNSDFLYIVPLSILPIVLKAFFDARLGLFAHVLTVLLLGFIVPNSFEFIYLHIIAGIVTILTISELHKRANLFISISQITLVYMITYFAFSIIKEGNASQINVNYFMMFAANGVLSFLSVFFIYMYEKIFGLVSDVTLLELSNTNTKLLRALNEKAPGTFQHSMQVANLAEAAANEIGA
ncbi:MAG: phosphohydrolase, partial [Polaribacter sp.]|nr:phosphohydrolase [Polaribacter sp.]